MLVQYNQFISCFFHGINGDEALKGHFWTDPKIRCTSTRPLKTVLHPRQNPWGAQNQYYWLETPSSARTAKNNTLGTIYSLSTEQPAQSSASNASTAASPL